MIIFVGDKPSKRMKPNAKPFEGAACEDRLKEWIKELNVENYIILNRFDKPIWTFAKWFTNEAVVVALGNNAAQTLRKYSTGYFKLPHPSGRNRQINDKEFISKRLEECKLYIKQHSED